MRFHARQVARQTMPPITSASMNGVAASLVTAEEGEGLPATPAPLLPENSPLASRMAGTSRG
jgi:hypothetical protein